MNVRSFAFLLFFVAFVLVSGVAQGYKLGFTAGTNYSFLHADMFETASGRLGAVVGCSFLIDMGDKFEFNQEIIFTQKGASARAAYFQAEQQPDIRTYSYYYNTFETGVFVGYKPMKTVPVRFQLGGFCGTHFHVLDRNSRELFVGNYENVNFATRAVDLNDAFSGVDYGPAIGVSGGDNRFRINARYYYGLRNLYKNLDFVEGGHSIRTSALRLTLTCFL
jgi:hypothetical protein